jgi:hypothetical protein
MSWNQITQIECDECHRVLELEVISSDRVEAEMRRRGWRMVDGARDLCEDCHTDWQFEQALRCKSCGHLIDECQCEPLGIGEDD